MKQNRFPTALFLKPTVSVAKMLLGATLVSTVNGEKTSGIIVEVEAYGGAELDEACHAHRGVTERTAVMFKDGGIAYVYFIYGIHHCINVVTEACGTGAAVLIRALEPLAGIETMERRRRTKERKHLTNGPGKLCEALGISKDLNGECLRNSKKLYLVPPKKNIDERLINTSTRIGISKAKDKLWRFSIKENLFVSRGWTPSH